MLAYSDFARFYDLLTDNVEYAKRAEYFLALCKKMGHTPQLALDLACGTGSLTIELARRGVDIYGVDSSVEMLSEARQKCYDAELDLLFLCQKMQQLDLYGTVDTVFCTLDSLNHLPGQKDLLAAMKKVSFFMDPGGWFFFDMNTPYKHREILGNNTFVYDLDEVFCVWQNAYAEQDHKVSVHLDFFEPNEGAYYRSEEDFTERAYDTELVLDFLRQAGFFEVHVFDELTFDPPRPDSQRLVYAAKKADRT